MDKLGREDKIMMQASLPTAVESMAAAVYTLQQNGVPFTYTDAEVEDTARRIADLVGKPYTPDNIPVLKAYLEVTAALIKYAKIRWPEETGMSSMDTDVPLTKVTDLPPFPM